MTYNKFFIGLMYLFVSNSFALEIMTLSEESALQALQEEYDIDSRLISANNKLSGYNKSQYDYRMLGDDIKTDKRKYDQLVSALPEKIIASIGVAEYFKKIEDLVLDIERSEMAHIASEIELKEKYQVIEIDYETLNDLRLQKNRKLSVLKKQVVDRIVDDFSKSNSKEEFTFKGTTICSKFQSINNCLTENEKLIVSKTKKSSAFLNERSLLLSYKINSASMNMQGRLTYNVTMAFKPSYTTRIEVLLNEKFGLESALITLESNVVVDWFVDGQSVGTGKKVSHEVSLGRHGILAYYKSQGQSSIEVIDRSGVYNYSFDDSVVPLMPKKKSKLVSKSKLKVEKANSTLQQTPVKKSDGNATDNDKFSYLSNAQDYLYLIGIDAAKQTPSYQR